MITKWLIVYVFDNISVDNSNLCFSDVGKNVSKSIKHDKSTVSGKFIIITDGTMLYNLIYYSCV